MQHCSCARQVVVVVKNRLSTDVTAIHWHGIHVVGTPWMDGVGMHTQCAILPGQDFTYRFKATPAGTHFYHDHMADQRRDGLFGMLIVHKKGATNIGNDKKLMLYDWYTDSAEEAMIRNPNNRVRPGAGSGYMRASIRDFSIDGSEVSLFKYQSTLINGRGRSAGANRNLPLEEFPVMKGQRYRFRMVHSGPERAYQVSVDDHMLELVALDGIDVKPMQFDFLTLFPGETLDFVLFANKNSGRYWLRAVTLREGEGPDVIPETPQKIIHGEKAIIIYNGVNGADPTTKARKCTLAKPCSVFNCPFAGYPTSHYKTCIGMGEMLSANNAGNLNLLYGLKIPRKNIKETFLNFAAVNGASVNAKVFASPAEPFYQPTHKETITKCTPTCLNNGCTCTHMLDVDYDSTVQLVFANLDPQNQDQEHHPIHTHGHNWAILKVGYPTFDPLTGRFKKNNQDIKCHNTLCSSMSWRNNKVPVLNEVNPPVRDTITVPAGGYVVLRAQMKNPGFWIIHCHISSHIMEGMALFLREATLKIPKQPDGLPVCRASSTFTAAEYNSAQGMYCRTILELLLHGMHDISISILHHSTPTMYRGCQIESSGMLALCSSCIGEHR